MTGLADSSMRMKADSRMACSARVLPRRPTTRLTDGDRQADRRVSTRGPRSVIATVCSKCADREPSAVTIVHRSGIVRVLGAPAFTIGSIAIVRPGVSFIRRFGLP